MKIYVKEQGKIRCYFIFPTRWLFNKMTFRFAFFVANKAIAEETKKRAALSGVTEEEVPFSLKPEHIASIISCIRRYKDTHGVLPLVDVETTDGTKVQVVL